MRSEYMSTAFNKLSIHHDPFLKTHTFLKYVYT